MDAFLTFLLDVYDFLKELGNGISLVESFTLLDVLYQGKLKRKDKGETEKDGN